MRRKKGLGSVLLAVSLVVTQLPINGGVTASAEEKEQALAYEYETIGNTGAVIEVADVTGGYGYCGGYFHCDGDCKR